MTRRTIVRSTALRSLDAPAGQLAPRQVKVQCSGQATDRMGDVVVQSGIDLGPFLASPTVLWNHDPAFPIARAAWVGLENGNLCSVAQFPPEGTDETSDRVFRLIKNGVPLDVSIGFVPIEAEPIDPRKPWAGTQFLRSELLEWSFVSIGAQRDSRVLSKGMRRARRDATPPAGNCGRPVGNECGMREVAECSIHGFGGAGVGRDEDLEAKLARIRRAAELQHRASGLATIRLTDDRPVDAYLDPAQAKEHVQLLRARHGLKHLDPQIVAARAAFRLGRL